MRRLIIALTFMLLLSVANAQTITIGVEPAKIDVHLIDEELVTFKLYNEHGDTDAEYTIELEEDLKAFVEYEDCDVAWCLTDNPILVPKGTTRQNPVTIDILFKRKTSEEREVESGIFIYGEPVGSAVEGTVAIKPRVKVKVNVHQTGIVLTEEDTEEEGEEETFDWGETTTTSTKTTSKTTAPRPEPTVELSPTPKPERIVQKETKPQAKSEGFNWMWVVVPVAIAGVGVAGFLVWKLDLLPPFWFPFIFLFLSLSIVKADSVNIGVTVGEVFDYFDIMTGLTQTVENDTVIKETSDVYLASSEQVGDKFTYHIANNRSTTIFVKEIILENPMIEKEYRTGSIVASYMTHSGERIEVEAYTTTEIIHVRPHSEIPIEPSSGSNILELDFNPNVVGFTVGILPMLTAVGIVLFVVKQFLGTKFSIEMITGVLLTIIIAIALLGMLIATI